MIDCSSSSASPFRKKNRAPGDLGRPLHVHAARGRRGCRCGRAARSRTTSAAPNVRTVTFPLSSGPTAGRTRGGCSGSPMRISLTLSWAASALASSSFIRCGIPLTSVSFSSMSAPDLFSAAISVGELVLPVPQVVDLLLEAPSTPCRARRPRRPAGSLSSHPLLRRSCLMTSGVSLNSLHVEHAVQTPRGGPGDNHAVSDQTSWKSRASVRRLRAEEMQLEALRVILIRNRGALLPSVLMRTAGPSGPTCCRARARPRARRPPRATRISWSARA